MNWWMNRGWLPPLFCRLHLLPSPIGQQALRFHGYTPVGRVCARVAHVWPCRWCKSGVGRRTWGWWGHTWSRTHRRMLQCRIQANRQGCIFRPFSAPHVCTGTDRRLSAEGSAECQADGGRGGCFNSTSNQPPSVLILSLILQSERSWSSRVDGRERPSTSCPPRSQRASPSRCQQRLPGSATWSDTQQPHCEMSSDARSIREESFRQGNV